MFNLILADGDGLAKTISYSIVGYTMGQGINSSSGPGIEVIHWYGS
ncbi:hypothetical protein [Pedobacter sp. KACC 23697]|uniref:Uncharacterized protein n=1 Tax=Pedobacter sp. KACC 23697 TaxID=3149230 RepID=A0AAU7K195_9SPHI